MPEKGKEWAQARRLRRHSGTLLLANKRSANELHMNLIEPPVQIRPLRSRDVEHVECNLL
eukprot:6191324-Pleurochrysis_carterae.AAC.3